ncbi:hypothetical protein HUJ05_006778 [Dendroctonus ponderosae]|nr:hypothetical protein HUJ05_006778 [Dendroctonus ponderosae]
MELRAILVKRNVILLSLLSLEKKYKRDLISHEENKKDLKEIKEDLKKLEQHMKLHKLKADSFYKRKKQARKRAMKDESIEAITMDCQKNLPVPKRSTNDVYYRR